MHLLFHFQKVITARWYSTPFNKASVGGVCQQAEALLHQPIHFHHSVTSKPGQSQKSRIKLRTRIPAHPYIVVYQSSCSYGSYSISVFFLVPKCEGKILWNTLILFQLKKQNSIEGMEQMTFSWPTKHAKIVSIFDFWKPCSHAILLAE